MKEQVTNRHEDFTWWEDEYGCTVIGDSECNVLARRTGKLEDREVKIWCDGYDLGKRHGIDKGKAMKSDEVKRVLGIEE